ncbi:MAG: hypothetical protein ABI113_11080 [Mucilaginibacter sp.]
MVDLEVEFDRVFSKYGGSLKLKRPDAPAVQNIINDLDIIIKTIQEPQSLPVPYIGIIDSYDVNAIVMKDNGIYFIGLFNGAILWIHEIFRILLSCPNVLPEIGESHNEQLAEKIMTAQFINLEHYVNVTQPKSIAMPKDPIRIDVANHFASNIIVFLLLHEYGHIVNGHVDALNSLYQNQAFEEKLTNAEMNCLQKNNADYIMFRQTCEYDADAWATNILLQFVNHRVEGTAMVTPSLNFIYSDYKSAIYYYSFSINTYWKLFGLEYEFGKNLLENTHPPSGMRQHFIMALITTVFQRFGIDYADDIGFQCAKSSMAVEKAFQEISNGGYNPIGIATTYQGDHLTHSREIRNNWKNVRPLLEPFAYVKLAHII